MLKKALFALYLLKGWMNFNQSCTDISLGDRKELIRFWDLDLTFKVTGGQRKLKKALSALCFLKGWMDFNQTCTDISLGYGKEVIIVW